VLRISHGSGSRGNIVVDGKTVSLSPGMGVTADIRTGIAASYHGF
jgi:hypothetical protein